MNIRDHHSKFGFGSASRLETEGKFPHHGGGPSKAEGREGGTGDAALRSFQDALSALGESNPGQFAGVLNAIAGELRAAADHTRGDHGGLLDALADQFDGSGESRGAHDGAASSLAGSSTTDSDISELSSVARPRDPGGTQSHDHLSASGKEHDHADADIRGSEALLSKILDAVSSALAKVATDSSAGTVIVESVDGITTTTTEIPEVDSNSQAASTTAA